MIIAVIIGHIAAVIGGILIGAALIIHGNQYHFPGMTIYGGFPAISRVNPPSYDEISSRSQDELNKEIDIQKKCQNRINEIKKDWNPLSDAKKLYNLGKSTNLNYPLLSTIDASFGCSNITWFHVGMGFCIGILMLVLAIF
jgi:hypothetical protein